MAHKSFPDFLHDPGFHQPGIERVAEIMEAVVPDPRPSDGGLPSGLYLVDRVLMERKHQP